MTTLVVRRTLAAIAVLALLFSIPPALAVTKGAVDSAKQRVAELEHEIGQAQSRLDGLQGRANALATAVTQAQAELARTEKDLKETQSDLSAAAARYEGIRAQLVVRARAVYISGPGNNLAVLLDSGSFAELSDRLEFVNLLSQDDADLATQVENLRTQLSYQERRQEDLRARQADAVSRIQARQDELQAQFQQQEQLLTAIQDKKAEAESEAAKLGKQYRQQVQQQLVQTTSSGGGSNAVGSVPFNVCPVGQPHSFGDGFGAPRYGGGFHLHAGVDIFAPMGTPIHAPFSGTASNSSDGLGGLTVTVSGSQGYVYNAHLSRYGKSGSVQAGDVIGYVGDSGDAQGTSPHDHFEWHPSSIPSNWPESTYGYAVIADALNPYPILSQIC